MNARLDPLLYTPAGEPRGYIEPHVLRELWFHTGTACNLACPFCLEGSKPGDWRLGRITLEDVRPLIDEAVALGVEQFSFTGGEPFIVKDVVNILHYAARFNPCLVLTNGTEPVLKRLKQIETLLDCPHPVAFRVSIDHPERERHEAGRGAGTFDQAWRSLRELHRRGFKVSLARQMETGEDGAAVDAAFRAQAKTHNVPADLTIVKFPDFLPLIPLLERAGGVVTDWSGHRPMSGGRVVAAATPQLHRQALDILNG